jgi:hypothetical protein
MQRELARTSAAAHATSGWFVPPTPLLSSLAMTSLVRARPDVPPSHRGRGELVLRYDDVSQDGRLACRAMPHSVGPALYRETLRKHPAASHFAKDGIVPILSRLTVQSHGGPIGVLLPVSCDGAFSFVRTTDAAGRVRYRTDMWVDITGRRGSTHGPLPTEADPLLTLGHLLAEHVLTRPFGPRERRQVDALPAGIEANQTSAWQTPESALELPEGAEWIDAEPSLDPNVTRFGLGHTDSNQHVNSLVYPQMIEDAALRRAFALGETKRSFCHFIDVAFRKPSFAGDTVRVSLRAYRRADAFGVSASIVDASDGKTRRIFGRLELVA